MTSTRTEPKSWDFSHIIDLVNILSTTTTSARPRSDSSSNSADSQSSKLLEQDKEPLAGLGDFSRLWNFLGSLPESSVESPLFTTMPPYRSAYTSDGALYHSSAMARRVKWRDEAVAGGELTDTAPKRKLGSRRESKRLARIRCRKQKRVAAEEEKFDVSAEELEAYIKGQTTAQHRAGHEIGSYARSVETLAPQQTANAATSNGESRENNPTLSIHPREISGDNSTRQLEELKSWKDGWAFESPPQSGRSQEPLQLLFDSMRGSYQQQLPHHLSHTTHPTFSQPAPYFDPGTALRPFTQSALHQPSLYNSPQQPSWQQPICQQPGPFNTLQGHHNPARTFNQPSRSQPLVLRKGNDRKLALHHRLVHDFGAEREWLANPVPRQHYTKPVNGEGVHVFIDFSNIWIGFTDMLKSLEGQHLLFHQSCHSWSGPRTPRYDICIESLVLLLERGRPAAKQTLAGSAPIVPAVDVAKEKGYELNILDRVYKAPELTEKQRRIEAARSMSGGSGSGSGSGGHVHEDGKWVEQGVDEILQGKMSDSIIDGIRSGPAIMVLATGDGAPAEFSPGFRAKVIHALENGWHVELVSWRASISNEYRYGSWLRGFERRFRIIELDDYIEFLVDT